MFHVRFRGALNKSRLVDSGAQNGKRLWLLPMVLIAIAACTSPEAAVPWGAEAQPSARAQKEYCTLKSLGASTHVPKSSPLTPCWRRPRKVWPW